MLCATDESQGLGSAFRCSSGGGSRTSRFVAKREPRRVLAALCECLLTRGVIS